MKSLCESKIMCSIGSYSYSLFLFHLPIVSFIAYLLEAGKVASLGVFFYSLLTLPAILFTCYLLYLVFEKPFLKSRA